MAKAVLVVDMPESCFYCKLQSFSYCRIAYNRHAGEGRPGWCPLLELPERETGMPDADDLDTGM